VNRTPRLAAPHASGVPRTYLSKPEKDASYPGLEIIAKLAAVLEVEPAELIMLPVQQPNAERLRIGPE